MLQVCCDSFSRELEEIYEWLSSRGSMFMFYERTRLRLFRLNLMQICTSNRLKQLIKVIKHCAMRSHKNIY